VDAAAVIARDFLKEMAQPYEHDYGDSLLTAAQIEEDEGRKRRRLEPE